VHGYSLLRTQLNNDYFHDIFDVAERFDVHLESHRAYIVEFASHT
jgi:glutamine synthetase